MIDHNCPHCGAVVATTNGFDLYLRGETLVPGKPKLLKWPCFNCGRDVRWHKAEVTMKSLDARRE
jgi:endogenous inhibitor of DNA gyrase (YacG/DUF329 family)